MLLKHHETVHSRNVDVARHWEDYNDVIHVENETNADHTGMASNAAQKKRRFNGANSGVDQTENLTKNLLTSMKVSTRMCQIIDGKRKMITSSAQMIHTNLWCTNADLHAMNDAMIQRLFPIYLRSCRSPSRQETLALHDHKISGADPNYERRSQHFFAHMRFRQCCHFFIEKLIYMHLLHPPALSAIIQAYDNLILVMKEHNLPWLGTFIRFTNNVQQIARAMVIDDAITQLYFLPRHSPFYGKEFHPMQLMYADPYLTVQPHQIVLVLSMIMHEWAVTPDEVDLAKCILEMHRQRCPARHPVDPQLESQYFALLEQHQRAAATNGDASTATPSVDYGILRFPIEGSRLEDFATAVESWKERYELGAWSMGPNRVHVILQSWSRRNLQRTKTYVCDRNDRPLQPRSVTLAANSQVPNAASSVCTALSLLKEFRGYVIYLSVEFLEELQHRHSIELIKALLYESLGESFVEEGTELCLAVSSETSPSCLHRFRWDPLSCTDNRLQSAVVPVETISSDEHFYRTVNPQSQRLDHILQGEVERQCYFAVPPAGTNPFNHDSI